MAANDDYQDILIRHQIGLERLKAGMTDRALVLLDESERDLLRLLREGLENIGPGGQQATRRKMRQLRDLFRTMRERRREVWRDVRAAIESELDELALDEVLFQQQAFSQAVRIAEVQLASPSVTRLRGATRGTPFQGRTLGEWFGSLERAEADRLLRTLRIGYLDGNTIDELVTSVRGITLTDGSRARGALPTSRRQLEAVVRTAVTHFATQSRETIWEANADIIRGLKWTSVLDGRTTPICQSRDGKVAPIAGRRLPKGTARLVPSNARPPAHVSCRSAMVAIIDGVGAVGTRPFVTDTRGRRAREVDFRRMAREQGRPISDIRREWADRRVGTVPAETTYEEWLRRQPPAFQREVLGPDRFELFTNGDLTLDDFVDYAGQRYTLADLRRLEGDAFSRAGL